MKKIIALLIGAIMVITISACSNNTSPNVKQENDINVKQENDINDSVGTEIQKSAYERLSVKEKAFVDLALRKMDTFIDPYSVEIRSVWSGSGEIDDNFTFYCTLTATNQFGGTMQKNFMLNESSGFDDTEWRIMEKSDFAAGKLDENYDVSLINEAIAEKR